MTKCLQVSKRFRIFVLVKGNASEDRSDNPLDPNIPMVVVYTASRAFGRNGIDPNTELILNTYPSVEGGYNAVMDIVSATEKFVPSTGHDTIFLNNGFIVNVYRTTESGEKRYVHTYSTQTLYERSLKGKPIDFTVSFKICTSDMPCQYVGSVPNTGIR